LVIFSEKPIEPKEFLNRMVEALGIIVDSWTKGKLHKAESQTIEKMGCVLVKLKGGKN
jgi:hypothetical protein